MWEIICLYIFLFTFLGAYCLCGLLKNIALRHRFVDLPDGIRKLHEQPVPLLGGIAMYGAFTLTVIAHSLLLFRCARSGMLPAELGIYVRGVHAMSPQIAAILGTTLLIVLTGVIDDRRKLSARTKLAVQTTAAIIIFLSGIRITLFQDNPLVGAALTIGWIIGITNAFNLLDNMDGLSCGTALISSGIFFIVAFSGKHYFVATILACFGGALSGFFPHNFPRARMFMGDAGSLFIGYTLSVLTILNTYYTTSTPTIAPIIMPLLILAVPIFDTLSAIYIRVRAGVSIFTADTNHFSHRLVRMGMTRTNAVQFIFLVNFCIGTGALLLRFLDMTGCVIVLIQAVGMLGIIVLLEKEKRCGS